jgi:hypothetical protein
MASSTSFLTISTGTGPVKVPVKWVGIYVFLHRSHLNSKGWMLTHKVTGKRLAALACRYPVALAVAKGWDPCFEFLDPECPHEWRHVDAFRAQLADLTVVRLPQEGPVLPVLPGCRPTAVNGDGGEQFPVDPTIWARRGSDGTRRIIGSKFLRSGAPRRRDPVTGRPVKMSGDIASFRRPDGSVLRLWWRDRWIDLPTIAQVEEWTFDTCCETPDGDTLEPDAPESWLRLLGLV